MRDIMRFLIGAQASGSDKRYRGLTREKNTIRKQQEPRHRGRQRGVHPAERVREEPQVVGSRRPPEASPVHRHAELLDCPAGKVQSRPQRCHFPGHAFLNVLLLKLQIEMSKLPRRNCRKRASD